MKLPKARITLDLDHDLLEWVMRKVQETKNSRNEVIGQCIRLAKESEENDAPKMCIRDRYMTACRESSIIFNVWA